jgi:hypothetical protein
MKTLKQLQKECDETEVAWNEACDTLDEAEAAWDKALVALDKAQRKAKARDGK